MVKRDILPAVSDFSASLASAVTAKRAVSPALACSYESALVERISALTDSAYAAVGRLETALAAAKAINDGALAAAIYYRDAVLAEMSALRTVIDELETMTADEYWPYPTYADLMFRI